MKIKNMRQDMARFEVSTSSALLCLPRCISLLPPLSSCRCLPLLILTVSFLVFVVAPSFLFLGVFVTSSCRSPLRCYCIPIPFPSMGAMPRKCRQRAAFVGFERLGGYVLGLSRRFRIPCGDVEPVSSSSSPPPLSNPPPLLNPPPPSNPLY